MNGPDLRALLAARPLLADGGMGTWLLAGADAGEEPVEVLNRREPDRVIAAHRAFVGAGARLVLTNTFGANRYRLERHGLAGAVDDLVARGVPLARAAGAELVGGSIGPLGVQLQPYGRVPPEEALAAYAESAAALVAAGVDVVVIETQTDLREMALAVRAVREADPAIALAVSATFTRDDRTLLGDRAPDVAAALADLGVDVIGVNCGEGPAQAARLIRAMAPAAGDAALAARPNAGGPSRRGGRFVYPATPAYVAEVVAGMVEDGVRMVGGCCGTGPAHIRAMAGAIVDPPARMAVSIQVEFAATTPPGAETEGPTALARALEAGAFPIAVEMEPPRSFDASASVAAAATLREAGATVVDVADSPMAKMRMSAWAACRLIEERAGIETVLHFPTRGRNLVRLQGDLLGARALGVRNLFVVVGDPVAIGDYPQALDDVDVTATGLLHLIHGSFNEGIDRAGASIGAPAAFFAGAAVSPLAEDLEREVRLLQRKVDAGARFLLTQPLFDPAPLVALRAAFERTAGRPLETPVLAGVLPLASPRHASFLHNEVPGIRIPDRVRDRLAAADDPWAEGRATAVACAAALRAAGAAGIYLIPGFGRFDRAAEVIDAIQAG
ncbi:MAG TPA: bifunctional homocysteine S-methyltransferase/methylenetetrahydrofolate reductase [Actinomycetota bacterium]|nr:bifunctional homocysteine S-methyltransferase/methylenetetrahydrofolate reductase [Actinomycetota bacterium]